MRRQIVIGSLALLIASAIIAVPAEAKGRGWGARRDRVEVRIPDWRRDVLLHRIISGARQPPGWDRGRKVGWGGCDVPPGLVKKLGCRQGFFFGRQPRRAPSITVILRIP